MKTAASFLRGEFPFLPVSFECVNFRAKSLLLANKPKTKANGSPFRVPQDSDLPSLFNTKAVLLIHIPIRLPIRSYTYRGRTRFTLYLLNGSNHAIRLFENSL